MGLRIWILQYPRWTMDLTQLMNIHTHTPTHPTTFLKVITYIKIEISLVSHNESSIRMLVPGWFYYSFTLVVFFKIKQKKTRTFTNKQTCYLTFFLQVDVPSLLGGILLMKIDVFFHITYSNYGFPPPTLSSSLPPLPFGATPILSLLRKQTGI